MEKKFVTKTKNGKDVYVDLGGSHAATHVKLHPELLEYMREILSQHEADKDVERFETDMGRVVGTTDLVETKDEDDIFYAKRENREKYSRFVRGKNPTSTNFITIDLRKVDEDEYDVYTVFFGKLTPSFPYGKDDPNEEAREFWERYALVAEGQPIVPGTETTECPW